MRVSFEWLREFVPVSDPAEVVAHRLTMAGLEIEAMEPFGDDVIFEVNVTPNRADCLSVVGLARELSALYGLPLRLPEIDVAAETGELDFNIDIIDPDLCHRYVGRILRDLALGPSPQWLRERVEKSGIRSINNVVDVTNYVLVELGHPLHAFDLDMIKGHVIRVGTPGSVLGVDSLAVNTLDGIERTIPRDGLLIWDAERPVAIAGIMGGLETEVQPGTTNIFIESAYFDPRSVRRTSKVLGLKTESSYRFERGTDIKMLKKALDRAALLMKKVAGGHILGKIDIYPRRHVPVEITVRYEKVNAVLGLALGREEIVSCLKRLQFDIAESATSLKVKPPVYRSDVRAEWDVIEEISRLHGYERIPARLPAVSIGAGYAGDSSRAHAAKVKRSVRQAFLKSGFTEVINYSFMGTQDQDLILPEDTDSRRCCVEIRNPLRGEDCFMRTTLVPGLLKNVRYNIAQGNRDLRFFEIAKVFIGQKDGALPDEREHLGAVWYREKTKALYQDVTPDYYVLKGLLDALLADLKIFDHALERSTDRFLHPGQGADIYMGGRKAGFIGSLSPAATESLGSKAQSPSTILLDIDLTVLVPLALPKVTYEPLTRYPYVERDTAVIVDAALESSALLRWVKGYETGLIEDVSLFDVFQGGSIPPRRKSMAFRVRYRAADRTLTDSEVEELHGSLVKFVLGKTGGQLRQ